MIVRIETNCGEKRKSDFAGALNNRGRRPVNSSALSLNRQYLEESGSLQERTDAACLSSAAKVQKRTNFRLSFNKLNAVVSRRSSNPPRAPHRWCGQVCFIMYPADKNSLSSMNISTFCRREPPTHIGAETTSRYPSTGTDALASCYYFAQLDIHKETKKEEERNIS